MLCNLFRVKPYFSPTNTPFSFLWFSASWKQISEYFTAMPSYIWLSFVYSLSVFFRVYFIYLFITVCVYLSSSSIFLLSFFKRWGNSNVKLKNLPTVSFRCLPILSNTNPQATTRFSVNYVSCPGSCIVWLLLSIKHSCYMMK